MLERDCSVKGGKEPWSGNSGLFSPCPLIRSWRTCYDEKVGGGDAESN